MENTTPQIELAPSQLAEFEALRKEIENRSNAQHQLITLNLTAIGTFLGFVLSSRADLKLLLLLPILAPAIGLLYLDHAVVIGLMGSYIQNTFGYNWEKTIRTRERDVPSRFLVFGIPIILIFGGIPIGALIASYSVLAEAWTWALWILGASLVFVFLYFWIRFLLTPFLKEMISGEK